MPDKAQITEFLNILPQLNGREVAQMPTHADFIAQYCEAKALNAA